MRARAVFRRHRVFRAIAWGVLALALGVACGMLSSCFRAPPLPLPAPVIPGAPSPPPPTLTAGLPALAVWGTFVGGLCLLVAIVVGIWLRNARMALMVGGSGVGLIVSAQLLAWVSRYAALLAVGALALILLWMFLRLRSDPRRLARAEKATGIDLNRDGKVG